MFATVLFYCLFLFCWVLFQRTMKLLVVSAVLLLFISVPTYADDDSEESDSGTTPNPEEFTPDPENTDSDSTTDPPSELENVEPESPADSTPAPENLEPESSKDPTPAPEQLEPETSADPTQSPENFEPEPSVDTTAAPKQHDPESESYLSPIGQTSLDVTSALNNQKQTDMSPSGSYPDQSLSMFGSTNEVVSGADQASQYLEQSASANVLESVADSSLSAGIPISRDTMTVDMSQQNMANSFLASSSGLEPSAQIVEPAVSANSMSSAVEITPNAFSPVAEPIVQIEVSASDVLSSGIPVGPVLETAPAAQSSTGSLNYETQFNSNPDPAVVSQPPEASPSYSAVSSPPPSDSVIESAPNAASSTAEVTSTLVVSEPSGASYSSMAEFLTGQKSAASVSGSAKSVTKIPVTTEIPTIQEPPMVTTPRKPPPPPGTKAVHTVSRITKKVNRIINFHRQKFTFYRCQTTCLVESIRCMRSCRTNTTFVLYKDDYMKCGKKCRVRQYHCKKLCKTELTRERTEQMLQLRGRRRH